ncbi:Acyl-CoA synthetase (AMP-forming)/AMP-acid ligase II [Amycolatopsis arida]|uniref:Acyl-CoA synthetase (AMP-forming)/AMP-acid ligase II n=1 Tax=Amycolatopsis arida TaxID=587909 RepID=A0A1I5V647_9PSEU|nr:AMP-binding protein [Amycolatopsis arida]TDX91165.1 acyl-CoA synthetase (AMP-forming)/AMP-acid ligase II [Amycolatopsis arida]SFQ02975.1 Acyl-CoA synthetase (AMP-forming)/AMP-acid ligase II [Amycolatopsis arida]
MILQRIGNRGLFLGALFDDALRRNPYQRLTLDHELDVAPGLGRDLTVYSCALLVADLAAALRQAGVRPGDTVAVHKRDGFDIFLLGCAISRAGAVPMLLSPALPGTTVARLLDRAGWPALVTDGDTLADRLPDEVADRATRVLLVAGGAPGASDAPGASGASVVPGVPAVTPLRPDREAVPQPFRPPRPGRPGLITHTSGTTDVPKLVVHTPFTLRARYRPQALATRLLVRRRETLAIHVSFVHSRLVTVLAIALRRGFPVVIVRNPDPAATADLFAAHQPGILEAHPNTFVEWEVLADDPRGPLANVKYVSSTFDAIHPRTVRTLLGASRRRRPAQLQLYGQSEVGPTVGRVTSRRHTGAVDGRCVGFPFPGMTAVRVVPRDGRPPGPDAPGYVEVRTAGRAVTYLGEDARFRRQLDDGWRGGWWRMGDVGYRTRLGCLHVSDREVDLIPGFGSLLAVEDTVLSRLDALLEVVIVPDGAGAPTPVVVTRDGAELDLARWRRATADLPAMLPPVQLDLDELPRTATTKVRRRELARRLRAAAPG